MMATRADLTSPNSRSWTVEQIDRLAALVRDDLSLRETARLLGMTPGQVSGQIHRCRQAGDPRFAAREPRAPRNDKPSPSHQPARDRADRDALAKLVADGTPLTTAAWRLQLGEARADRLWGEIVRALGWQAA